MLRISAHLFFAAVLFWALNFRSAEAEIPVRVAVSVAPQKFFLERLLGPAAEILVIIPKNGDHENFEPGISQLQKLSRADAFVLLGHPRATYEQQWLERLRELRPSGGLPLRVIRPPGSLPIDSGDMHYWTSPRLAASLVAGLSVELQAAFPHLAPSIKDREAEFLAELRALDRELTAVWAGKKNCSFLVYHAAWGYFARDYGLTQIAFEVEGREPGLHSVARTFQAAKAAHIRTLFIEPQRSQASVQSFADELGASIGVLDPLAEDWENNLRLVSKSILEACSAPL